MARGDLAGEHYDVRRRQWFSASYDLHDPAGHVVGSLEAGTGFSASAVARAGKGRWNIRSGWRSFSIAGDPIAGKAQPVSWLDSKLELRLGERRYWIRPASWFNPAVVSDRADSTLLWFQPRFIRPGGIIGFRGKPDEQALLLALFTYFHHLSRCGE
jgi:hypothetical protein